VTGATIRHVGSDRIRCADELPREVDVIGRAVGVLTKAASGVATREWVDDVGVAPRDLPLAALVDDVPRKGDEARDRVERFGSEGQLAICVDGNRRGIPGGHCGRCHGGRGDEGERESDCGEDAHGKDSCLWELGVGKGVVEGLRDLAHSVPRGWLESPWSFLGFPEKVLQKQALTCLSGRCYSWKLPAGDRQSSGSAPFGDRLHEQTLRHGRSSASRSRERPRSQ
jgi:hypothetical protein